MDVAIDIRKILLSENFNSLGHLYMQTKVYDGMSDPDSLASILHMLIAVCTI